MRKKQNAVLIIYFLVSLISIGSYSQKVDLVVNKGIYTSYYSTDLRVPLYVIHYLYNGGGDFSRSKLRFIEEKNSAKNQNMIKRDIGSFTGTPLNNLRRIFIST